MKTVLLLVLSLAAAPAWAQMQPPPPTFAELRTSGAESPLSFNGANIIVLHTTDSAGVAYRGVVRAFLAAGFGLDKTNREALFVNTSPRPCKGDVTVTAQAVVEPEAAGSKIIISGVLAWATAEIIMRGAGQQLSAVKCHGMKGSPARSAWDALESVASAYPAAKMGYAMRP